MSSDLQDLSQQYWDVQMVSFPSFATLEDDHRYDDRIEDWSAAAERTYTAALGDLVEQVRAIDPVTLDDRAAVTRDLLINEIDDTRRGIELRLTELASDQMTGPHTSYLQLPPQTRLPEPAHAIAFLDRYRQMGAALRSLMQRFREGLESGRTPAHICIERSLTQLDGYLGTDPAEDIFTTVTGPEDWTGGSEWRAELAQVVAHHVRPAFAELRDAMANELEPVARDDDHPGLCHLDDGPEIYRALIRHHTSLGLTAEELHDSGVEETTERLRAEYRELGERVFATADVTEIFERLRNDPELRYETGDQILDAAGAALARAREVMDRWFGRLPQSECVIEPVPPFLQSSSPPAYYWPPSPDGGRPGTYYVNTYEPHNQSAVEAESIGFHEAIPGHHLQLAIASELEDLPMFQRRSFSHTAYVEGWGLYAERLADEMELYSSDLDRIGMLIADSWRAGRLVVDTGLHAMGWSRQQAIDWYMTETPIAPDTIAVEVDRYIAYPGQALAYKVGQREIFRLRNSARERLGETFDISAFHDVVLGSGSVSLPVLGNLVERWLTSASPGATS